MSVETKKKKMPKSHVIGLILISLVVLISSVALWQLNEGKRLAEKLTNEAVQSAQQSSQAGKEDKASMGGTSQGNRVNPPATPKGSTSYNPDVEASGNPSGTQGESKAGEPANSDSGKSEVSYKELVKSTYFNTLQTMENVKANTLALQSRDISLTGYRASINQARQNFAAYEEFLLTNPPTDSTLKAAYQDFLSGVTIARDSMDVVLSGISSLNPSSFYAARDMGKTARDKVVSAYSRF